MSLAARTGQDAAATRAGGNACAVQAGGRAREMSPASRRVAVLANACAGAGKTADLAEAVIEHLRSEDHRVVGLDCRASAFGDQIEALHDIDMDAIVAVGGDGTVNAAAAIAMERDAVLAAVPAGTMDLIARDFGVYPGRRCLAAVHGLSRRLERTVDVGFVNGRPFLHSSLIGLVPALARAREQARGGHRFADRLRGGFEWIRRAFASPTLRLTAESDRGSTIRTTRSVAITVNPLDPPERPFIYRRSTLDGGLLAVYASAHSGPLAPLRLLMSLGRGDFRGDPQTLADECRELTIHNRRAMLGVSVDGEALRLRTPLRYTLASKGLRVACPTAEGSGGASA